MQKRSILPWLLAVGFAAVASTIGYLSWYGYGRIVALEAHVAMIEGSLASTTSLLKDDIEAAQSHINDTIALQQKSVDTRFGIVSQQVGSVTGTVDTLQKLSKADPQLLAKYSKVYFLNEHYAPERVTQIPQAYVYSSTRPETIQSQVWPHLQAMLDAAKAASVPLYVASAYRSFDEQKALKSAYSVTYGAGTANQFSAEQGYSEHQLGTALDMITTGQGGQLSGFEKTSAYQWLLSNAYQYGFILSYPASNTYYIFEPWHWRYVGVKLATDLHNQGKSFYELDQRDIDAYIINLFE